jgi:hypothetical protein
MNSTITSKLYMTLHDTLHSTKLQQHIMKKHSLPLQVFNQIHWDAHEKSFVKLTRHQKIHTCKLIHALVNTNRQNKLYYGTTNICPMCQQTEETFLHVPRCSSEPVSTIHQALLTQLLDSLLSINTPRQILLSIQYGMQQWVSETDPSTVHAPSRGSLKNGDIYLQVSALSCRCL